VANPSSTPFTFSFDASGSQENKASLPRWRGCGNQAITCATAFEIKYVLLTDGRDYHQHSLEFQSRPRTDLRIASNALHSRSQGRAAQRECRARSCKRDNPKYAPQRQSPRIARGPRSSSAACGRYEVNSRGATVLMNAPATDDRSQLRAGQPCKPIIVAVRAR